MTPENYAAQPLRPYSDSHGDAGIYLVQMQTDALQEPFTRPNGSTQTATGAGEIATAVWESLYGMYANQYAEAAVLTPNGITALVRLFEASTNTDDEPRDGSFFADHANECPWCAKLHAMQEEDDDPNAFHTMYDVYGSAAEFVMELRSEIARAVWSRTGQRGTQFWSTIQIEPVADITDVINAHRAAMKHIGIALPIPFAVNDDNEPEDCSQN